MPVVAAMVADMHNRFLVALLFSLPIVVWSPIGSDVLGLDFRCRSGCGRMCGRCC